MCTDLHLLDLWQIMRIPPLRIIERVSVKNFGRSGHITWMHALQVLLGRIGLLTCVEGAFSPARDANQLRNATKHQLQRIQLS